MIEGIVIGVHVLALHARPENREWFTPGIYAAGPHWGVGVVRNSFRRTSFWAGLRVSEREWPLIGRADVLVGAINGYASGSRPLVAIGKTHGPWRWTVMPKPTNPTITVSYEFR